MPTDQIEAPPPPPGYQSATDQIEAPPMTDPITAAELREWQQEQGVSPQATRPQPLQTWQPRTAGGQGDSQVQGESKTTTYLVIAGVAVAAAAGLWWYTSKPKRGRRRRRR